MLTHGKQVFNVVIGLKQHAQNAVLLAAWRRGNPLGHFFLNHAYHGFHLMFMLQNFKKNLTADVVGEVSDNVEGTGLHLIQIQFEYIRMYQLFRPYELLKQKGICRFLINFDYKQGSIRFLKQILRQHPCPGPDFQKRKPGIRHGICNFPGNVMIGKKMLSE